MPSEKQIEAAQKVFLDARPYMGSRELATLMLTAAEQAEPAPASRSGAVKVVEDTYERYPKIMDRLAALEQAEPATDVEPVAWLMREHGTHVTLNKVQADEWGWDGKDIQPLFTHPPESRLREALEAMLEPYEDDPCRHDHHGYCQAHFLQEDCCVANARATLARNAGGKDGE